MKKLLLLTLIAMSQSIWAQGISVVNFKLLETDLTANMHGTRKVDQNGETAALIRIVTKERGFTFEGGSLGIVGTEFKNGEIWLYVPRRAQKITISHQSFGVLRDYYYPISIQGGKTYEQEQIVETPGGRRSGTDSGCGQRNCKPGSRLAF